MKVAGELKILRCLATASHVIIFFSEALDVPGGADPTLIQTYRVWPMASIATGKTTTPVVIGSPIPLVAVSYEESSQTSILQLAVQQNNGQKLLVAVDLGVTSKQANIKDENARWIVTVGQGEPTKDDESAKEDEKQLRKILQPPYAIGVGLLTQDDYNNLKNEYFSQSELSLGLILPMVLIVLGLLLTPQLGLAPPEKLNGENWYTMPFLLRLAAWAVMCAAIALISMGLFIIGAERYQKFRLELKLLILGNWQKQQDAKKSAGKTSTNNGESNAIKKAVAKLVENASKSDAGQTPPKVDVNIKI